MAKNKFSKFGVMIDMSRNAVMKPEVLKQYMQMLKKMGYNCVLLYTEDTYEVDGEPHFGHMRGRYTKEEMRDIDDFGASLGMEVIPCIQTLAHMHSYLRWCKVAADTEEIMMVGDERTYELIDHMFATLSTCFRTRVIHVGMDEAHMLGRGWYMIRNGYEDVHEIVTRHLSRVTEIAKKYGYDIMVWSDVFFRPWNNDKYAIPKTEIPKKYIDAFPSSVVPVYWEYCCTGVEAYDDMMYNHRQINKNFWFAGGVWTWTGFMPHNDFSIESMLPALEAARANRVKNMFFTMWGDNGAECSRYAVLPSLFYLAQVAKGNTDEEKIKEKFERTYGVAYDDFLLLDRLDHVCGAGPEAHECCNPSKYMLLSDTFNGFLDYTVEENVAYRFDELAEKLAAVAKKTRRFHLIFDTAAKLASVLAIKYDLGVRVRAAYQSGDKEALSRIAKEDYPTLYRRVNALWRAHEKQWMAENKPAGIDTQQLRFAGILARLEYCRKTLLSYLSGSLPKIDELEAESLPFLPYRGGEKQSTYLNNGSWNMTLSVF